MIEVSGTPVDGEGDAGERALAEILEEIDRDQLPGGRGLVGDELSRPAVGVRSRRVAAMPVGGVVEFQPQAGAPPPPPREPEVAILAGRGGLSDGVVPA